VSASFRFGIHFVFYLLGSSYGRHYLVFALMMMTMSSRNGICRLKRVKAKRGQHSANNEWPRPAAVGQLGPSCVSVGLESFKRPFALSSSEASESFEMAVQA